MTRPNVIKVTLLLVILLVCFLTSALHHQSYFFRVFWAVLLPPQWILLVWSAVWVGTFLFLTFGLKDLPLIGLLIVAVITYFNGYAAFEKEVDAITLVFSLTLGKGARVFLEKENQESETENTLETINRKSAIVNFLVGLVVLLTFASWWHLDMSNNYYHGPRWIGLWDNPNIYGMLMSAGMVLAIGLLRAKAESAKRKAKTIFLVIAIIMMGVGLVMSYSRGAWLATVVGLLYLAWCYSKLKWRYVMLGMGLVALGVLCLWGKTPDAAPWYVKRADLGRSSAQHRATAWRAGLEIMRDHPLGVGWNNAVSTYEKNYSPPKGGAAAITTNDYMMLGTELGIPALLCFVVYVGLTLKSGKRKAEGGIESGCNEVSQLRVACRAGAIVLLVAFWFDGGLFTLPTAAVFWVLLELGAERQKRKAESRKAKTIQQSGISPGFTLVELLVVVAIIGILAALLLPVLSKAKLRGFGAVCLSNQKQLALAWQMYADDNAGRMVNFSTFQPSGPLSATNTPWRTGVFSTQLMVTVPPGDTPEQAWAYQIEMGFKQPTPAIAGPLFKYAPNAAIIRCPGDVRLRLPFGLGYACDSYSGVALLNGEANGFTKEPQVLSPSQRFLWAEGADMRGENIGSWVLDNYGTAVANFTDTRFGDSPAAFHGNASTFSFLDGHAESHRWLDSATVTYANSRTIDKDTGGDNTKAAAQIASRRDLQWIGSHYPGPQNP